MNQFKRPFIEISQAGEGGRFTWTIYLPTNKGSRLREVWVTSVWGYGKRKSAIASAKRIAKQLGIEVVNIVG